MNERIYMSSPDVGEREEKAIVAALRSGWVAPSDRTSMLSSARCATGSVYGTPSR